GDDVIFVGDLGGLLVGGVSRKSEKKGGDKRNEGLQESHDLSPRLLREINPTTQAESESKADPSPAWSRKERLRQTRCSRPRPVVESVRHIPAPDIRPVQ